MGTTRAVRSYRQGQLKYSRGVHQQWFARGLLTMKQLIRTGILAVTVLGGLAACSSLHVISDVNRTLVGSVQCHSFAWAGNFSGNSPLRDSIANPVNEARLRTAITAQLILVGVQAAPPGGTADCLVGYGIGARTSIEGAYPAGWGWGYGWGWRGGFYGGGYWGWDEPYIYHEGIIAVDLYDARSKQPIWHASANQSLDKAVGADAERKINQAVSAIFTKYPR
jgi:Domain of unknown function (DUF4136)